MKSKFAIFLILIMALCVSLTACKPDIPVGPGGEPVEYVELTYEEFKAKVEEFTVKTNYISNVTGYKFAVDQKTSIDGSQSNVSISGIVDITDFEDVALSVNIIEEYNGDKESGGDDDDNDSGAATVRLANSTYQNRKKTNVYLYGHNLYVDIQENNKPVKKDSIKGFPNNLYDLFGDFAGDSSPVDDLLGLKSSLNDVMSEIAQYTKIEYCERDGHFIIETNFLEGEIDDADVDSFTSAINLFVKNKRFVEVKLDFASQEVKLNAHIKEDSSSIDYPDDPDSYKGKFLDKLEKWLTDEVTETDFYGQWDGSDDKAYYVLDFTEEGATLNIYSGENEETIEFDLVELTYGLMILVADNTVYFLEVDDDGLILTLPDMSEVTLIPIDSFLGIDDER